MIEIAKWWYELDGMTLDEAKALAESHNMTIRVRSIDGKPLVGTADYRRDRFNVSLINGIVKATPFNIG